MNCWEFMKCGREADGINSNKLGICPAYPSDGKRCANVVGTFCDLVQALHASQYISCPECPFYNSMHFEETSRTANQLKAL